MFAYHSIPGQEPLAFDQGLGGDGAIKRVPGPGKFHGFCTDPIPVAIQDTQAEITLEFIQNCLAIEGDFPRLEKILQLKKNHWADEKVFRIKQMAGSLAKELCLAGMKENRAVGVEEH